MNGVKLVVAREIRVQVASKAFVIGLVISALVVAGIVAAPKIIGGDDAFKLGLTGSQELKPALDALARQADVTVKTTVYPDEAAARAAVDDGKVKAAVAGGRLLTDGELDKELAALVQGAHRSVESTRRLAASGIDPGKVQRAFDVPALAATSVTGDARHEEARRGLAMMIVVVLFLLLITSSMGVAMGVVEEKSSRIVEILLIAVRPWELLAGKIIAIGVLGLAQLAVFALSGLGTAAVVGALPDLPPGTPGVIALAFAGYLFGYAFFAAMAAALASLVSRQEELSNALGPMNLLMMVTYGVSFWAAAQPDAPIARTISMIPPFSSMVMPVRAAAADVPAWQVALAIAGLLAAVAAVLLLGARVYERAILRTGAKLKLAEVLRGSAGAAR
ncbi:ABC transporter permease [Spirillospora sp. CA-294931]|uniref:ABC transporter permease n=1 Tax=Spirillospora sp. CA-294931 TaxID=3240042 RepID=UPI003D8A6605